MKRNTLLLAIAATVLATGCANTGDRYGGRYERGYGYDEPRYRTTQHRDRHYRDYDTYPASQSAPAPAPAYGGNALPGQVAGAVAGGLLGAQVGRGNGRLAAAAVGATAGAVAGGRLSDPCQPSLNIGHGIGAIAGGILGSTVGGGSGRTAATAIGAATGAIVGGNMARDPDSGCR